MPGWSRQGFAFWVRWVLVLALGLSSTTAWAQPNHTEFYLGLKAGADHAAGEGGAATFEGLSLGMSLLGGDWFLELEVGGLLNRVLAEADVLPQSTDDPAGVGRLLFAAAGTHVPLGPGTVATGIFVKGRQRSIGETFTEWAAGARINYPWRLGDRIYWAPGLDLEAIWIPSNAGTSGVQASLQSVLRFRVSGPWWIRTEVWAAAAGIGLGEYRSHLPAGPATVLSGRAVVALSWVAASP